MKKRTKEKIKGSVTVLVVIILLPMLAFSSVIVDLSRINLAKAQVSSAGELCLNTALADYDTILKDVYGLFAMSQNKSQKDLKKDIKEYFVNTITGYGVVEEEDADEYVDNLMNSVTGTIMGTMDTSSVTDFLKFDEIEVEANGVSGSELSNPKVLRNQILEYMKFRAPISIGMSFFDSLASFSKVEDQNKVLDQQIKAQQSTQKVTNACSDLIKLIREYDKLVVGELEVDAGNGTKAKNILPVYLKSGIYDTNKVELAEYPEQLLKYESSWEGSNYEHINLITLVFLVNSPTLDTVYLSKMDYAKPELFINAGIASIDNSGITVEVTLADNTAAAKEQVMQQISTLTQTYKATADKYINCNFIDEKYLKNDLLSFTDEDKAMQTFIEYEKYLKDESSVLKYSEVKLVLEELYKLEKYHQNYLEKINAEIAVEESKAKDASNEMNSAVEAKGNARIKASDAIQNINNQINAIKNNGLVKSAPAIKSAIEGAGLLDTLPTLEPDQSLEDYFQTYFYNTGGIKNKYEEKVDYFLNTFGDTTTGDFAGVTKVLKKYRDNKANWNDVQKEAKKLGNIGTEYAGFIRSLITCSNQIKDFEGFASDYNEAQKTYNEQEGIYYTAIEAQKKLEEAKQQVIDSCKKCFGDFESFSNACQKDAYNYSKYIKTAENIVEGEATNVCLQYMQMVANIEAIVAKLDAIIAKTDDAIKYIETYQDHVKNWKDENDKYKKAGDDSFSDNMDAGIEKSETEYNLDSFNDLKAFIVNLRKEYNGFLVHMIDLDIYTYGGEKIMALDSPEKLKTALQEEKAGFPQVIDKKYAEDQFSTLYKNGTKHEYDPYTIAKNKQLQFLKPMVIQIQALRYLNSAYPESYEEESSDTDNSGEQTPDDSGESLETTYENQENDLANQNSSVDSMDSAAPPEAPSNENGENPLNKDGYGYTYQNHTNISKESNLPSNGTTAKSGSDKGFDASMDDDGDIDVDDSKDAQTGVMGSLLSGIGDVMTAGLENAYILAYLCENFSYNTVIQDTVVEQCGIGTDNILEADKHLTAENINRVKDTLKTSSNYHINGENNYLFGAELEYILFGNKDNLKKNITYTKGGIYAIRFGFNCIFAFTDTEIRTSTMSVGLAVQAATLGIVPYQLVQIVLQLALAAAESAIDLKVMSYGLDVAVVKSKDTWALSLSSISKDLVKAAAVKVADVAQKGIADLTAGLQNLVDAGADEIKSAAINVGKDLEMATAAAVEDVINKAFDRVISTVEGALNELQSTEWGKAYDALPTKEEVRSKVDELFTGLESKVLSELKATFAGNELALKALGVIEDKKVIEGILSGVKESIDGYLKNVPDKADPCGYIISKMTDIKLDMIETVTGKVNDVIDGCEGVVTDAVEDVQESINKKIGEVSGEISEEVADKLKNEVSDLANDYIGEYIDVGNTSAIGGGSSNSSFASVIKFGYKEYMMLFLYIDICANGDNVMKRTADVIQMNLKYADSSYSEFSHGKGADFKMADAFTYVEIDASAELEMFFVKNKLFSGILNDETSPAAGGETGGDTGAEAPEAAPPVEDEPLSLIKYRGMLGY